MTKQQPQVEKVNFVLDFDVTFESFLKRSFEAYKITGASEEWEAGFRAGIAFCSNIVEIFCNGNKGAK